jgi:hypothetical protein
MAPELEPVDADSVIGGGDDQDAVEEEDMGMEYMIQKVTNKTPYWGDISDVANQEIMYWDDMSGEPLISSEVQRARTEEMEEFKKHQVYTKVPIQKCWDATGKGPIGVRWVDINKGDKINPEYRSRLVAKEIKLYKTLDFFAATPPLEAKKMLFSLAVTSGIGFKKGRQQEGMKVDFIDVRRAYFHADARRQVFVELPQEDAEEGMCGELGRSMYGTRDAAQNWEFAYLEFMTENAEFEKGKSSPCIFWHKERNVRVVVHGDDFTVLGNEKELDWFRGVISKRFEVKFRGRIGPAKEDDKSIRLLNRVIE